MDVFPLKNPLPRDGGGRSSAGSGTVELTRDLGDRCVAEGGAGDLLLALIDGAGDWLLEGGGGASFWLGGASWWPAVPWEAWFIDGRLFSDGAMDILRSDGAMDPRLEGAREDARLGEGSTRWEG